MSLNKRISEIVSWGEAIFSNKSDVGLAINNAYLENKWFSKDYQRQALDAIYHQMLSEQKLTQWVNHYSQDLVNDDEKVKTIALIMAGNIPLVGFHDFLSVIITGHRVQIKLSSKDKALWLFILKKMEESVPNLFNQVSIVERVKDFDAVIATGSNNSARYFEYYFGKYPNIIRKNRNSIAVLTGEENEEELLCLGKDIFSYFGLGCRNISHLLVPVDYDFKKMLDLFKSFDYLLDNDKYKNNFDYQLSIMLLNKIPFLQGDAILLKEDKALPSPISTVHYQFYSSNKEIDNFLNDQADNIQCIVGKEYQNFGSTQKPELLDYADNVDVIEFLLNLKKEEFNH